MRAVVEEEKVQRKRGGAVPTVTNSFQSSVDASQTRIEIGWYYE